eukprot:gene901-1128_t
MDTKLPINPIAIPQILFLVNGNIISRAIYVATRFSIPDELENGPRSSDDIAQSLGIDLQICYRLMRLLSTFGVFHEEDDRVFSKTDLSSALTKDSPCRNYTLSVGGNTFYQSFNSISDTLLKGKTEHVLYDFIAADKDLQDTFSSAMTHISELSCDSIVKNVDFSMYNTIVDLGGCEGGLSRRILSKFPSVKECINFDLPQVIEHNRNIIREGPEMERLKDVAGSFFDSVPSMADAYTIKHCLHNFNDEKVIEILKNIKKSMKPDSKIYVFDFVFSTKNEKDFGVVNDFCKLSIK